jgi:hypothetical protein
LVATRKEAQLLRWHQEGRKKEFSKFRHPADAAQWGNINNHFKWFNEEISPKKKGKHHKNAREDLKNLGIRPELYVEETKTGTDLPVAATTLSKAKRK